VKSASVVTRLLCAALLMLSAFGPAASVAADGQVRSYVISGGGGVSSGGGFRVMGTIGQHAVTVLRGGNFVVQGGFWYGVDSAAQPTSTATATPTLTATATTTGTPRTPTPTGTSAPQANKAYLPVLRK
jgi:hypothetical protein